MAAGLYVESYSLSLWPRTAVEEAKASDGHRWQTAGSSMNSSNRDAFGNIIEIPGTPDPQSAAGKGGAKNTLSIVEIEIYEKQ